MSSKSEHLAYLYDALELHLDLATEVALEVLHHPETGYLEERAAGVVASALEGLGFQVERGLAITGLSAVWESGRPGPTCLVAGELDALIVPDHPFADPRSGAAHACGHHAQLGVMVAVAAAFAGLRDHALAGRVRFVATPAEETIEVARKLDLRRSGAIEFIGGKQEMVRLGVFDNVDMAFFTHATSNPAVRRLATSGSTNGHLVKEVRFVGREAHAGAAPHEGINALKAATLTLVAIDGHREAFRDQDSVRVHPVVTRGGGAVNVVPGSAVIETYVRAANLGALMEANERVDLAAAGSALAVGAGAEVTNLAGYLPLRTSPALSDLLAARAADVVGAEYVGNEGHMAGTTDVGDISHLIPTANLWFGGAEGGFHSADFVLGDHRRPIGDAAKAIVGALADLLDSDGTAASDVTSRFEPALDRDGYMELLRSLSYEKTLYLRNDDLGRRVGSKGWT